MHRFSQPPPRLISVLGSLILLVLLNASLSQCQRLPPARPDRQPVRVQQVISGEILEVLPLEGEAEVQQVRLIGIEAPDWRQEPWGEATQRWLRTQLEGQTVELESDVQEWESADRRWGYLWQGQHLVNGAIVAAGHALVSPQLPNVRYRQRLQRAQETARLRGVGIWNPDRPLRQTPSQFRQRQTKPTP